MESVFGQSFKNVEVIVVDDGSTDGSKQEIAEYLVNQRAVPFIDIEENVGNTTAFNRGLALAKGKYIVDLSCDDVLESDRLQSQVDFFERQNSDVGVIYSDAMFIDENGRSLNTHFSNPRRIPYEGDVYAKVVSMYFVPAPTMMIKKKGAR